MDVIMARRKSPSWYIGGINAEKKEKKKLVKFDFLPEGIKFKLVLIADGQHDKAFTTQYMVVDNSDVVEVKLLRCGGFVAYLTPI